MKLFLVLTAVLFGLWLWRSRRLTDKQRSQLRTRQATSKAASASPIDMVCCTQCGVHIPKGDAITGKLGLYCCAQHQYSSEP